MALITAWQAFNDPESTVRDLSFEDRKKIYSEAWNYYRSKQYSTRSGENWAAYLQSRELYKHLRLIYNPVPGIVDFYVDNIWQPARDPKFPILQTPLSDTSNDELRDAVAQLDQWGNFLSESQKMKRYAAATGNVLIEIIDDIERGKVLHRTIWPGYVKELILNSTGDVIKYVLEYDAHDPDTKKKYRYRKEVTRETFSYFRDDRPFTPPGRIASVEPNPYEFCPAVWIKHTDDGGDYGLPACLHFDKVDELNSVASHLHDNIHKNIESPKLISSDGDVLPIIGASKSQDQITPHDPRTNWIVFKTKDGGSVSDLAGSVNLADSHPYLKDMLTSFSDDYPELQAATVVQQNAQLSGAALERMLTPAQNRLDSFQSNYNDQLIKLRQMQIAIAGFRANGGGWSGLTRQQAVFKPFNLKSYESGDLDFSLMPAALIGETEYEREELLIKKATRATMLEGIVDLKEQQIIAGYSEDEITEIDARLRNFNRIITDENEQDEQNEELGQ